ncbi:MAG: dienelactone hydrolase-like enzyme [Acidimicrobiales bacterium]|jgi:dienelactone hydrolase|nr:dienelactone hydrolase-like enzyme [Acidimicrobiales bacterium]
MRIALPSGCPAELARPDGEPTRGVVLLPDIMGLRPLFDDMCARLATEHGWAVCAPEPYPGRESLTVEERLSTPIDDEARLRDIVDAADALNTEPVGVIGFCQGGMYTLKAAGTGRFDKAVAFYGMVRTPDGWRSPTTVEPLDQLAKPGAARVLAIVGGKDHWTPPEDIEALRALPNVEVVVYPEADHGFVHDPTRPVHRAKDAADAWARAFAFLNR